MGGLLVVVEVFVLSLGVLSRYVFHSPLVWTDELASLLFLWLAMLGAVVAYWRLEHMRMGALVDALGERTKGGAHAFALLAGIVFLGLLIHPAIEYARDEAAIVTPALEISNIYRALALPVGVGLMQSGFSRQLAAAMTGLPGGAVTFMAVSIVAFIILGSVLEGIPAIVLFGPLMFPIAKIVGIHEIHYAMVVILAMGIGLFAPPFGVGYYAACAIGRVDPSEGIRPIGPYLLALLAGIIIVALFPWISTGFLPAAR
jgi:TRAP-type C4-dicarboxylate transport system permease small subunit